MTEPNQYHIGVVEDVVEALKALGFEEVVICTDGSEPCASFDLGRQWLDVTACVRDKN